MTPDFCVEALQEALEKYGKPEIFNTDQGSQFTSGEWIDTLKAAGIQISMDGEGRWTTKPRTMFTTAVHSAGSRHDRRHRSTNRRASAATRQTTWLGND
jgi:transposase InsO family protein